VELRYRDVSCVGIQENNILCLLYGLKRLAGYPCTDAESSWWAVGDNDSG
jgi:hypothetical protein